MLNFDSKKMMLVDEKGQPFTLSQTIVAADGYDFGREFRFTLPICYMATYNSIYSGAGKISFDLISPIGNTSLYRLYGGESATNKGVFVANISAGVNHITVDTSVSVTKIIFALGAYSLTSGTSYTFSVTNIVLGE